MSSLHFRFAGLTLLLLLLWGISVLRFREREAALIPPVEIAVEHGDAAALSITRTIAGSGFVDVRNDGQHTLKVSLPDSWVRGEVRGVPLNAIKNDEPGLGFRRWMIPAGATVTYDVWDAWSRLRIRNISETPLRLRMIVIDLEKNSAESESYLIDDQLELKFGERASTL